MAVLDGRFRALPDFRSPTDSMSCLPRHRPALWTLEHDHDEPVLRGYLQLMALSPAQGYSLCA